GVTAPALAARVPWPPRTGALPGSGRSPPTPWAATTTAERIAALLIGLVALVGRGDAQGLLDFVTFDDIDYIRWASEPGRPLVRSDLGSEFAIVGCSMGEDRRGCPFGVDAAAAFLPAGTPMFTARGYATQLRPAAVWADPAFLYHAVPHPRAKPRPPRAHLGGRLRAPHGL